jgi:hypothetical protein
MLAARRRRMGTPSASPRRSAWCLVRESTRERRRHRTPPNRRGWGHKRTTHSTANCVSPQRTIRLYTHEVVFARQSVCRLAPILSDQSLPTLPHGARPRTLPNTSRHCHWPQCRNTAARPIRDQGIPSRNGPPPHCRFTVFWQCLLAVVPLT